MRYFVGIALTTFLGCIGCADNQPKAESTYLGGEIVNPYSSWVIIVKNDVTLDTIQLDAKNRFIYEFTDFEPGFYSFYHKEQQMVYLEKGDSIMLRVNTIDFDESLSYTGIGAPKNNFIIDLFLQKEAEDKIINYNYQKPPKAFEKVLDSFYRVRKKMYDAFKLKHEVSATFDQVLSFALKINNYERKEQYPFSKYSKNKMRLIQELPADFYSFRESMNFNDIGMGGYYGYIAYLESYFDHQSFLSYGNNHPYNTFSFHHNIREIELIDSIVESPDIKDHLMRRLALGFMANNGDMKKTEEIYQAFNRCTQKESTKGRVSNLFNANKKMQPGSTIPDQILVDREGRLVTLHNVITKPTVIYFWSFNYVDHMENAHNKSQDLRSKYPEFEFIGINWNKDNERWRSVVKSHKLHLDKEYQFKDYHESLRDLAVMNPHSKTLILYPNGRIYNGHSNLFRVDFENELLAYLNQ